jgi:hypothetical protein
MIESLLGVQVTSPGAATVKIAPPAIDKADLNRASGSAWTQRGTVGVSWKRANGTYVLDVNVPANVTATVAIPNPGGSVKYVGVGAGAPKLVGDQDGRTVFTVGSGATHFSIGAEAPSGVGGSVPPTLSLTLGAPASFGPFTPGVAKDYLASTTANVISTAGDATLSVADPSSVATGHLVNGTFALPQPLQVAGTPLPSVVKTWSAPASNDAVTIPFKQSIGASDGLRTGTYSKTLTFTLSTTTP